MQKSKLTKGPNPKLAGVCSGIASFLEWDATAIRILWIFATVISAGIGGLVAYAVMAYVMPAANDFDLTDFRVQ